MPSASLSLADHRRLLQVEYEAEKEAFTRLADRIGMRRLVERGYAWMPVTVERTYHNSLNRRVVELIRTDADPDADDHSFEYGRQIMFFTLDGDPMARPRRLFAGSVSYVDGNRMVAVVTDGADIAALSRHAAAGVMISFDETTYRAMFDALDRVAAAKGRLGELRDLFCSRSPVGELHLPPVSVPYLNKAQQQAVNKVLAAKDVAIVHGPPGTGKTTTLVEAIHETLRRESQVLVCAQSNMAVDCISEKLTDRGINVLRLGNPSRVNDKMLSFTYERRFADHPDYPTLWSLRKTIRELRSSRRHTESWHQKMDRLRDRAVELEIRINADLFGSARVIACTLVGSASSLLEGMRFSTVFIDEAAQALEAACWIPLRRAGRVILAGDHCQLPPTVKSFEAMRGGLGITMMERLAGTHPEAVVRLDEQYRMHRDIMEYSNRWFYGGTMTAAPSVGFRGILDMDKAVEWIDTSQIGAVDGTDGPGDSADDFREEIAGESYGHINRSEAKLTVGLLEAYVTRIGMQRILDERVDIGIISPYRAQVKYLRRLIACNAFFRPMRRLVSVNTVDGFQGQERDVIIVSLVRCNDEGRIGFLGDLRRMNVAMTRARMKLIIVGDAPTLGRHRFYRGLIDYIGSL